VALMADSIALRIKQITEGARSGHAKPP
jgi:hypothetical protein